jgi:predicted nucleic acid-binding protein
LDGTGWGLVPHQQRPNILLLIPSHHTTLVKNKITAKRKCANRLSWMVHRGAVEIHNIENNDFKRLKELTEKYRDLPMDFADSCLVYIAEKLKLNTIATIDRDFSIYRIQGRRKFQIIFL